MKKVDTQREIERDCMYQVSSPRKPLLEELPWFTQHLSQCTSLIICRSSSIRSALFNCHQANSHKCNQILKAQPSTTLSSSLFKFMSFVFNSLSFFVQYYLFVCHFLHLIATCRMFFLAKYNEQDVVMVPDQFKYLYNLPIKKNTNSI